MADKFDFDQFEDAPSDAFDFDQFDDAPEQPEALPEVSQGDAALLGAQQGTTLGFSDELGAGMQAGMEAVHSGANSLEDLYNQYIAQKTGLPESDMISESATQQSRRMAEEGFGGDLGPTSIGESYDQALQENRADLQAAEEQHPGTFLAADIASSMLLPVPGGAALRAGGKLASKAGKIGKAAEKGADAVKGLSKAKKGALAGAGVGAVESAGRTEESEMGAILGEMGQGALGGGVLGGTIGKIADKFGADNLAQKADDLKTEANIDAMKSMGATKMDMLKELGAKKSARAGADKAKGTGTTALDEGVIKMKQDELDLVRDINTQLDDIYAQRMAPTAQKIDAAVGEIGDEALVDSMQGLEAKLQSSAMDFAKKGELSLTRGQGSSERADQIREHILEQIVNSPDDKKLSKALELRREIGQFLNQTDWEKSDIPEGKDFYKEIYGSLNSFVDDVAEKVDPALKQEFKDANKAYSNLMNAQSIAVGNLAKEAAKQGFSLGDYMATGAGGYIGGGPGAVLALGGKKGLEKFTGKDTGKLLSTFQALRKSKKAQSLSDRAKNFGGKDKLIHEGSENAASGAVAGVEAASDTQESRTPYKVQKQAAQYAEKASPEELMEAAGNIREQYGKAGEGLASTLEKISQKDMNGRRALVFSLMQDPMNRKMLGINVQAEPKSGSSIKTGSQ